MAFEVKIVFTGICSFVPRDVSAGASFSYCVVMPNAWRTNFCTPPPRLGVDRVSTVELHRPFLQFDVGSHHGAGHISNTTGLYFLEGKRVLVIPNEGVNPPPPPLPACRIGDISGLASFEDVTSSTTPPQLLSASNSVLHPHPCQVGAQVVLEHGVVDAPLEDITWVFDNTISQADPKARALNYEVTVTIEGLDSLTLRVNDLFTNAIIQTLVLDRPTTIRIANLCVHDPLRWLAPPRSEELKADDDFRLHYEIVDDGPALATKLKGLPCPIPRVDPTGSGGNGFNCFPKGFPPADFDPAAWH